MIDHSFDHMRVITRTLSRIIPSLISLITNILAFFMKAIRTNNDIEGWHLGLNRRASGKSQLPLYLLITLLHREARLTSLQIRLVPERKLRRIQRKKYRDLQMRIFQLWDEFNAGSCSARKLLKACSYLNGPAAS